MRVRSAPSGAVVRLPLAEIDIWEDAPNSGASALLAVTFATPGLQRTDGYY